MLSKALDPREHQRAGRLFNRIPAALTLFVIVLAAYAATSSRQVIHIDTHAAAVEAWHIAVTGSPWLEGDLSHEMKHNEFIGVAPNGHVVGMRMAGPVIAGIPFYWALNRVDHPDQFSYVPAGLAGATLSAAAVALIFSALRSRLTVRRSVIGALVFGFATPMWTISANMLWTHPITQLGIAGAAYGCARRQYWLVGLSLGFGMLGRPHLAVIAGILGLGLGWGQRSLKPVFSIGAPTVASLGFLALWSRWMFGTWSVGGAYAGRASSAVSGFEGSSEWDGPYAQVVNYLGFLVSPDRGLFVWTPLVLLMVPAVVTSWKVLPDWSRLLLLGGIVYSFFQLRLNYFPGGDEFYGYRHALELVTCGVPAFAFAAQHMGPVARKLLPVVAAVQFAAISVGAFIDAYYVDITDVWTDNSFWVAFERRPEMVGPWLAACVLTTLVIQRLLRGRSQVRVLSHSE